jgi:hypothetical protein
MVEGRTPWSGNNEIELAANITNEGLSFTNEKLDPHLKVRQHHACFYWEDFEASSSFGVELVVK